MSPRGGQRKPLADPRGENGARALTSVTACSGSQAGRYGPSWVMASKVSAIAVIKAKSAVAGPLIPSRNPPPSQCP